MVSFHMHHVVFKLNMCFPRPPSLQISSYQATLMTTHRGCSNPNDSDEKERNQNVAHRHFPIRCGRRWSGAAVHRTRSLSRYSECECEWEGGGVGVLPAEPPLSLWSSRETGSPQAARLFTLHPSRSCDFHMVSPPSLISAKSAGGKTGQRNGQIRSSAAKAKQKKIRRARSPPNTYGEKWWTNRSVLLLLLRLLRAAALLPLPVCARLTRDSRL